MMGTVLIPTTQAYKGKDYVAPKMAVVTSVSKVTSPLIKPASPALPAKTSIASVPIVQMSSQLKTGTPLTQTELSIAQSAAKSIVLPSLDVQPVVTSNSSTPLLSQAYKDYEDKPEAKDTQGNVSVSVASPSASSIGSSAMILLIIGVVIIFLFKFNN